MKLTLRFLAPILIAAFTSSTFASSPDDPEEGWPETQANMDLIKYYTDTQAKCSENPRNMLGCIQLINNLGRQLKPAKALLATDSLKLYPDIKVTVLEDFGDLQLVQVESGMTRPPTVEERELLDKNERDILTAASTKILAQAASEKRPDFDTLAQDMINELPTNSDTQKMIGDAINDLLEINDWHAHIDSVAYLIAESEDADKKTDTKSANLTSKVITDLGKPILYLHLVNFMDFNACADVQAAIQKNKNVEGIVLDLRDNPGGMVQQVTCIGSLFVGKNTILVEKEIANGKVTSKSQALKGTHVQVTTKPLTVLINAGSASASEILAGALQDDKRAWIVGVRSYGKGSVQSGKEHPLDPTIYWFQTTDEYFLPTGRSIQARGIQPDFEVAATPSAAVDEHFEREEDFLPYVLPPDAKAWTNPRTAQITQISKGCLAQNQTAERVAESQPGADYELLKAQEIMSCGDTTIRQASR